MDAAADILLHKPFDDFVSSDAEALKIELDDIQVPGMLDVFCDGWAHDFRNVSKSLVVESRIPLPCFPEPLRTSAVGRCPAPPQYPSGCI